MIKVIAEAAKRHGIYAGIHCGDGKMAKEMISYGYQFVTLLADNAFLAGAAKAAVAEMRDGPSGGGKASGPY